MKKISYLFWPLLSNVKKLLWPLQKKPWTLRTRGQIQNYNALASLYQLFRLEYHLSRSIRVFFSKRPAKIYHTVSLMISGTLSSCFDGNNWLIVKPDCIHISSTFWRPLISTKDLRTHLRNLGTCSPSRCFTDSSKNFIGSDFSDANTGATKKG